jgi:integrase/recombinase XerD
MPKEHRTSPRNWRFGGLYCLRKLYPPPGLGVWGWFDVSPSGAAPLILAPRFLLLAFSLIVTCANPPHIYSDAEIDEILRRTQQLPSSKKLRAKTYTTLFGLLAVTGMRANEAVGLDRSDVNLDLGILHIRRTKFGKSRYVPIHPSTADALKNYTETRDHLFRASFTPAFFISERGSRITDCMARYTFAKLSQQLGLRSSSKGHGRGPRLHDMRHRFAARTLINWYHDGVDVERELPKLATYLGHVHVNDTYWYLEAVPELLQLVTDRLIEREVQP